MFADEDMHRHAAENFAQADALLFGRVTYEMMEKGWRPFALTGARPDWMEPWMESFARTIDAAKKYVVSSTLDRVDLQPGFVDTRMAGGEFWRASPPKAARQIAVAIRGRKQHLYVTRRWRLVAWLMKVVPDALYSRL
ncbi:MAG TPA: hypothetical protein VMM79_07620 [Longimicrobiales bacterium]|nr:hypothetical protein [Longimicrobiales bacterium]